MATTGKPNILLIHSHDTGRAIAPYGYGVPTPRLQDFAEQAVLFRHAFSVAPTCSPSRCALMTGQYPHQIGMYGLTHRGWKLDEDAHRQHLATSLREHAGYSTHLIGFQHETDWGVAESKRLGYDTVHRGAPPAFAEMMIEPFAAFVRERSVDDGPWFLSMGVAETHRSATPEGRFYENDHHVAPRYARPPDGLPDLPAGRDDWADFCESAQEMDEQYGRILDLLDNSAHADNTLVIITTDHGIPFARHKCTLHEGGTGVFLMIRGPRTAGSDPAFAPGRIIDTPVSQLDLAPTLFALAGAEPASWHMGKSLLPVMRDPQAPHHETIFTEQTYVVAPAPCRSARTERYRYIRRFGDDPLPPLPIDGNREYREALCAAGFEDLPQPRETLYDLALDPDEYVNRIDDPPLAEVAADLRQRLDNWMNQTSDPLAHGQMPQPASN